jgi:predicted nucleic acid-binding protein
MCGFGPGRREAASRSKSASPSETWPRNSKSDFHTLPCIGICPAEERDRDGSASLHALWKRLRAIYPASRKPRSRRRLAATEPRRSACRRSPLARREDRRRGVVDTSVLVAGIAGFKSGWPVENPCASLLRDWLENATFKWLVTEDILAEYKEVLTRLGVRRNLIGEVVNLLREEAEFVDVRFTADVSPDPDDNPFCAAAEQGRATFIATLNRRDFPQDRLLAKVISPGDPIPTTRRRRPKSR